MKQLRFPTGVGDGTAVVPGGQILAITCVPGEGAADPPAPTGCWVRIANNGPIWVPFGYPLDLQAKDLGSCCGDGTCDRWPGDVQVRIDFGTIAAPSGEAEGDPPASWLVIYNGPG